MPVHRRSREAGIRRGIASIGLVLLLGLGTLAVARVIASTGTDTGPKAIAPIPTDVAPTWTPTAEPVVAETVGMDAPMRSTLPPRQQPVIAGVLLSAEDGYIADGEELSPFDDTVPALANLDPDLLAALQWAATDAEADGIAMVVNSGWRSEAYQDALLQEAIATYGSEDEARKWVDTPERSNHVTGMAVDIGPEAADLWLIEHGADYGLCQTYANEIWHFQLMTEPDGTCPPPVEDAAAS